MRRIIRTSIGFAKLTPIVALIGASVVGLAAPAHAAGPNVTIQGDSANLDYFLALNSTHTKDDNKSGTDFVSFGENLGPAQITGPEGKAKAFAQQASTIVTPSSQPFPTGPLNGIGMSGTITASATKSTNSAPGVPVATPEGSFSADFTTSGPTPFQFDGAMLTSNADQDDCTEITVNLSGPMNLSFAASAGGDCPAAQPHSRAFVVTDVFPAGDYTLAVDYSGTIDPEDPGSLTLLGKVSVNLQFFHRCSIVGTNAGETLTGTAGDDVICGRGGNDTINGLGGHDEIFGERGNDVISGGGGNDVLHGDVGNDALTGGAGDDQLLGSFGDDRLFGSGGNDIIKGDDGDDRGEGGAGADTLIGGDGKDTLFGQTGTDRLDGGPRPDVLDGGSENDRISAIDHRTDVVRGGPGAGDRAFVDARDQVTGVEHIN